MQKKILVVNAGPIYPIKAMNQMRTHNMIRTLSKEFMVDLLTPYIDDESSDASRRNISDLGGEYIPITSVKHKNNLLKKRAAQILEYLFYYILGIDKEVSANRWNNKKILNIIMDRGYKIVISNYWESSVYFQKLGDEVYKILDPHYAVGENLDILARTKRSKIKYFFEKRKLRNNIKMEKKVIENSDLLLPLSKRNFEEFKKIAPDKPMLLIPDGADLEHYLSYPSYPDPSTILFYGAMSSAQNRSAFKRFYKNIFLELIKKFPDLKLLVVGSNPPDEIKTLHNGTKVTVTGFVEDIRPWLSKAWLKVIPLELGSGFRGRVIELMALGIPVIGTHNALDSIGLINGKDGFIEDSDEGLSGRCIELLKNHSLRNEISFNARDFVKKNYSLEVTFGKLNEFLKSQTFDGSN